MKTTTSSIDADHASSTSETSDEARFKRANRRQVEMITLSLNQRLDVDCHKLRVRQWSSGADTGSG